MGKYHDRSHKLDKTAIDFKQVIVKILEYVHSNTYWLLPRILVNHGRHERELGRAFWH